MCQELFYVATEKLSIPVICYTLCKESSRNIVGDWVYVTVNILLLTS
jgi:hypothetical protein